MSEIVGPYAALGDAASSRQTAPPMPLEFALRPRFDLERPPPRRRLGWLRLPPFALPIAAYWLALAGVTHALLRSAAADEPAGPEHGVTPGSAEPADEPANDTLAASSPLVVVEAQTADEERSPAATSVQQPELSGSARAEPSGVVVPPAPAPRSEPEPRSEPAFQATSPLHVPARSRPEPRRLVHDELDATAPSPPPVFAENPAVSPNEPRTELRNEADSETTGRREAPTVALPSCESAAATANQSIDLRAARGAPDLTRDAFAAVLENGAYLTRCEIPGRTALEICAAVQNGKVVGVSVTTAPRNATIEACVRRAVVSLPFPRSSQLDVTRTRFAPSL